MRRQMIYASKYRLVVILIPSSKMPPILPRMLCNDPISPYFIYLKHNPAISQQHQLQLFFFLLHKPLEAYQ